MANALLREAGAPSDLDTISRFITGFLGQASPGYPPYDIIQSGRGRLRITLAVAGFAITDLSVSVLGHSLVIRGRSPAAALAANSMLLHRGIALRQFQRSFALGKDIRILGANLDRGLLSIELESRAAQAPVGVVDVKPSGQT
ncbi:MAG: Hsp20 family protein [Rhodospirillales bacterium]|nr:Hsp20 family protein [Rhodospirillales bacterium]